MKNISGKDFAKIIKKQGWVLQRINGSHHIYTKPNYNIRLSVPVHGNQPLKKGLLTHLIKISGITLE